MNKKWSIRLLIFLLTCTAFYTCRLITKTPADLVILNANVLTIDKANPKANAIAFKGGKILAVSSTKSIERHIKTGFTQVINANGRLVVPGFNDAHVHFRGIDPDYIDLRYITDPTIITDRVREKVAQTKPGELIRGGRWEHEMFNTKQWPTKELIDSVSPDNPVVLSRADGHSALVNTYVLNRSNITKNTPDPPGGEIQRDGQTHNPGVCRAEIGSLGNNLSLNAIEKAQELTMEEAIELYTLGSAYSEFMEERKGIIKKGYLGDVVIFDRDLLTIPFDQIMSTKVDYTIVGGKVIYQKTGKQ